MDHDQEEDIKARAYQLWQESGYAHGHHHEHWNQAKREIEGKLRSIEKVTDLSSRHEDGVSLLPTQDVREHVPRRIKK